MDPIIFGPLAILAARKPEYRERALSVLDALSGWFLSQQQRAEILVRKWTFRGSTKEVSLIRTRQDDLICEVFDRSTKESRRRALEKCELAFPSTDKNMALLIQYKHPEIVEDKNGPISAAIFVNNDWKCVRKWKAGDNGNVEVRLDETPKGSKYWTVFNTATGKQERWQEFSDISKRPILRDMFDTPMIHYDENGIPQAPIFLNYRWASLRRSHRAKEEFTDECRILARSTQEVQRGFINTFYVWKAIRDAGQRANTEISLHTWNIAEEQFRLVLKGDELRCVRVSDGSWFSVDDEKKIEAKILELLDCVIAIGEDGSFNFHKTMQIHDWIIDDKKIVLRRYGDRLYLFIMDEDKHWSICLPKEGNVSVENQISDLLGGVEPIVIADGTIEFARICHYWDKGSKIVFLLQRDDASEDLIYHLYDKELEMSSQMPVRHFPPGGSLDQIPESQHSLYADDSDYSIESQIFRLRNCRLKYVADGHRLKSVSLEPIEKDSRFGDYRVNGKVWAVTLVNADSGVKGHAELVIEGVQDGSYFMHLGHLRAIKEKKIPNPIPVVDLQEDFPREEFLYYGKSETWLRPREKVQELMNKIIREKNGKDPISFNIFGRYSEFSKQRDNCMTWAMQKLEMIGVSLSRSKLSWVVTTPHSYVESRDPLDKSVEDKIISLFLVPSSKRDETNIFGAQLSDMKDRKKPGELNERKVKGFAQDYVARAHRNGNEFSALQKLLKDY